MYEFNLGAFGFGFLILLAGAAVVVFHKWIGDNLAGGIGSYDKIKLWGVIGCLVGFIIMLNLHYVILSFLIKTFFVTG